MKQVQYIQSFKHYVAPNNKEQGKSSSVKIRLNFLPTIKGLMKKKHNETQYTYSFKHYVGPNFLPTINVLMKKNHNKI